MAKNFRPKVYDCFTFFNELDLLEIRLRILDPYIDKFVLVEMNTTFSGDKKEYIFEKEKKRFEQWKDKIIYVKVDQAPSLNNFYKTNCFKKLMDYKLLRVIVNRFELGKWRLEKYQRNKIMSGLRYCLPKDIIMISDVDEIPDPRSIKSAIKKAKLWARVGFVQKMFIYSLNGISNDFRWTGTKMVTYDILQKKFKGRPQEVRVSRDFFGRIRNSDIKYIKRGGWHFTYLGNEEAIKKKINSFSEVEKVKIDNKSDNPQIIIGKRIHAIKILDISKNKDIFPEEIYHHQKKYAHLIKKIT